MLALLGGATIVVVSRLRVKVPRAKSLKIERLLENFKMKLIHIPAKENLHMTYHYEAIQDQNFTAEPTM